MEQENYEWPPPPKLSQSKDIVTSNSLLGSPSDAIIGIALGFLINIVVVVIGSLLLLILGTMILGASQYGQTTYKPILPYFVLDTMFIFCQSPTILLFLHKRRQRGYYAYGMLIGSIVGSAFLVWFWKCVFMHP